MDQIDLQKTTELIARDFEIEGNPEGITEEQLFEILSEQIAYLIEHRLEFLLSLMYRLDVDERKVEAALSPRAPELAHNGLARLVLDRQKQRVFTKRAYKPPKLEDDEW